MQGLKKHIVLLCSALVFILATTEVSAQEEVNTQAEQTDTVTPKKHSPRKATIYSAVLPGLGQAYNEKYWKIPVIYAGFATTGYFMITNFGEYARFRDAYKIRLDDDPFTIDEFDGKYDDQSLINIRDYYRRNFELAVVATIAIYAINIVDASVDGHLKDFEINDDLSLHINPTVGFNSFGSSFGTTTGIKLTFRLK